MFFGKSGLASKYKHINWALADQAMVSAVNFLTGILLARYLGLEEYGKFTLAWMVVLLFNSFQQAGIIAPMMSIGPKQRQEEKHQYYGAVFIHQLIWSCLCFFIIWVMAWISSIFFPDWNMANITLPLSTVIFTWQFQDFIRRFFFVTGNYAQAFLNDAISYLSQLFLLFLLFKIVPLDTAMALWLISGTSAVAILAGLLKIRFIFTTLNIFQKVSKTHWQFSRWMIASALMQWVSSNFYWIVAGGIIGPIAVGGVKAAHNIMAITHILFQAMENFAPSRVAMELSIGGIQAMKAYIRRLTIAGTLATAAIALIVFIIPDLFLSLIYGPAFAEYAYILRWVCVTYLFSFFTIPVSFGLRALEETKPLFYSIFFLGVFNLLSAYPLVLFFELNGLMVGMLATKIVLTMYLNQSFRQSCAKE